MSILLNHTIVHARDKEASAAFVCDILGLPAPTYGPFLVVCTDNEVSLDYIDDPDGHLLEIITRPYGSGQ